MFRITTLFVTSTLLVALTLSVAQPISTAAEKQADFRIPETDDGLPGAGPIRRYDWFRNLWMKRRTDFATQVESKQGAVVFLGDSITQGWGPNLRNFFPGLNVANRGISGDTTRGMLIRLNEDVLALNPSTVIMLMGTNDLEEKADPETIAANVKLILTELRKHRADMPIVLCNVFPSSTTKSRSADSIKKINTLYASAVKDDAHVTVIDTWTLFADEQGDAKKEEFPDLLHPNDIGYTKWGKALRPILATLSLTDTQADDFQPEEGFVSLFNGHDLTGWGFLPTTEKMLKSRERWHSRDPNAPPWPVVKKAVAFNGKATTPGGRYVARNGRLVVTTPPEGRKIQQLWTTQEFGSNFTLKLEFRATPNADSGVFIRGPQLQCRDFALAGPYNDLSKYKPQDWNELTVIVKGGLARCTCNGELLEAEFKVPASGPIGLEGDRGQIEYRRIRIRM
ncbi:MAG: GDSL-type esterase/lipase family protein [Fuerstiella sp.]|nr:GDSL-type esterase/lipase family protein [Fuerstiella sp.]